MIFPEGLISIQPEAFCDSDGFRNVTLTLKKWNEDFTAVTGTVSATAKATFSSAEAGTHSSYALSDIVLSEECNYVSPENVVNVDTTDDNIKLMVLNDIIQVREAISKRYTGSGVTLSTTNGEDILWSEDATISIEGYYMDEEGFTETNTDNSGAAIAGGAIVNVSTEPYYAKVFLPAGDGYREVTEYIPFYISYCRKQVINVSLETSANLESSVNTYDITGTASADNYEVTVVKGTLTVTKASSEKLTDEDRNYTYSAGSKESIVTIDIASLLRADRGNTTYTKTVTDEKNILSDINVTEDGKLMYIVNKTGDIGDTAMVIVTAASENYNDYVWTLNVKLTDKLTVVEKSGAEVNVNGSLTLTVGEKISSLKLNTTEAAFVREDGEVVLGTLNWTTPEAVVDMETTKADWKFIPEDTETYKECTGTEDIQ